MELILLNPGSFSPASAWYMFSGSDWYGHIGLSTLSIDLPGILF